MNARIIDFVDRLDAARRAGAGHRVHMGSRDPGARAAVQRDAEVIRLSCRGHADSGAATGTPAPHDAQAAEPGAPTMIEGFDAAEYLPASAG